MYTLEFTFLYIAVRICLKIRDLLRKSLLVPRVKSRLKRLRTVS